MFNEMKKNKLRSSCEDCEKTGWLRLSLTFLKCEAFLQIGYVSQ